MWFFLSLLSLGPAMAEEPAERVARLLDADRVQAATWWARRNLADAPDDPVAWTLLGLCLEPTPEAEPMFRAAIQLDEAAVEARAGLARLALARGEPEQVVEGMWDQVLTYETGHPEAWAARVWLVGAKRPEVVDGALRSLPNDSEVLRAAAAARPSQRVQLLELAVRADPSHAQAWTDLARQHIIDGHLDLAGLALDEVQEHGAGSRIAWPLRRLLRCAADGTADDVTLRALAAPTLFADATYTQVAPDCAAAWAHEAAVRSVQGRAVHANIARGRAVELSPDPDLLVAHGLAHAAIGSCAVAETVLRRAWMANSWDADVARARVHCAAGPTRSTTVKQVWAASPHLPDVVLAHAAELVGRVPSDDILHVLVEGLEHTPGHLELTRQALLQAQASRKLDETLTRAATGGTPALPPIPDDGTADATVVVIGEGLVVSTRAAVVERLALLGYETRTAEDGTVRFKPTRPIMPRATLHPDGRFEVQESGYVTMPDGRPRSISRKKLSPRRQVVIRAAWPAVAEWQAAVGSIGQQEWLDQTLPEQLDALWLRGVPLDGGPLIKEPAQRRAVLLDYWASRTCSAQGEAVRKRVTDFIQQVVQDSEHAASDAQLDQAEQQTACGATIR